MGRFIRNYLMLLIMVCFIVDIITKTVDLLYCFIYFGVEFALIYLAIEDKEGK